MGDDQDGEKKKSLEATITSFMKEQEYFLTREFVGWWHQRQMRLKKKNYIGISYEEVTPSWWNLLQPDWLQYNHTEYCIGELEYSIPPEEENKSPRPWRLSIYGQEYVGKLVSFANRLGEECKVAIDVTLARKYPKARTWKEYRENKEEYVDGVE